MRRLTLREDEWLGCCSADAESLLEARLRDAGFDLDRPILRDEDEGGNLRFSQSIEH